jgi:hypothetical protein
MSDFQEASMLHKRVALGLGPEIFIPTSDDELESLLGRKGLSVGVWHDRRLVCMRSVQTDREWVDDSLRKMGLGPDPEGRTAVTDHCIVDKEYRGNNIQFLTNYELESMIAENFDTITTTVAPMNVFSLQNILNINFQIVGLDHRYGGYLRYTLVKRFRSDVSIWTNGHSIMPIRDLEGQRRLLSQGCVGYKLKRMEFGFVIFYAPVGATPPHATRRARQYYHWAPHSADC